MTAPKEIETHYEHNLGAVRPGAHEAVFRNLESVEEVVQHYDLLHLAPPRGRPDVITNSALANAAGWVNDAKRTLRHPDFADVFSLGDVSSPPDVSKDRRPAIRKEGPVLVDNVLAVGDGRDEATSNRRRHARSTRPGRRWSMHQLKGFALPELGWWAMLKCSPGTKPAKAASRPSDPYHARST